MGEVSLDDRMLCTVLRNSICVATVSLLSIRNFLPSLHVLYLKPIFLNILKIEDHDPENPIF
jgi:hypothetical protein